MGRCVTSSFETVPAVSLDVNGDVIVIDDAMRSSFRTIEGATAGAVTPTAVVAQTGAGRSGLGLTLLEPASAQWVGLFGSTPKTVRAAEFRAKASTGASFQASSGSTLLGQVSLIADGGWHRYVLPFPTDVASGAPLSFKVVPNSVGPNQPVVFDSLKLVARPFETVSLASSNGFQGSSVITATVGGLWSGDAHFMSAVRTSDGGAACSGCLHVPVPAGGSVAFVLSPGVYRVVVETGDAFSAVGVSATFTINAATTTTTTTTTTTLPEFTVGGNDVLNGYGEAVVLDDAFRSGFRMATPDAAATPLVARATQVKPNFAPSVALGVLQLGDYIRRDPGYQIASPTVWGFSANSGLIPIPWGTIQYNSVGGGVWGYTVSNIPALPDFFRALDSETSRQLARSWVDALSKPLPLSVVNAASAKSLVTAMRSEGYSSASVSFELFRRYEASIATGVKYVAIGVTVMGVLAALMWIEAESR